ncbi:MAG: uridine kinase [Candidatus Poribacteria bacterium]|nr:uridine kinase [Candidatus Poribacteria bacterium]
MQKSEHATPITVGIMGGSASGKTTFASALAEQLAEFSPVVLNQDSYFRDWSEYSEAERERVITANHPDAVLWDALITDIKKLRERNVIETPTPGTRAAQRNDEKASVQPSEVVIVEGHLIFWSEDLRDLMDIKLFLDVDAHERVLRRMLRDVAQRGGDLEWAINWYRRDVLPNFPVYTEPCKQYADLIIPFQDENPVALHTLVAGIRDQIESRKIGHFSS